jgi:hypothetical protein
MCICTYISQKKGYFKHDHLGLIKYWCPLGTFLPDCPSKEAGFFLINIIFVSDRMADVVDVIYVNIVT